MTRRYLALLVWLPWGSPPPGPAAAWAGRGRRLAVVQKARLSLSQDMGLTWTELAALWPDTEAAEGGAGPIRLAFCGPDLLVVTRRSVWAAPHGHGPLVPRFQVRGEITDIALGPGRRVAVSALGRIWTSLDCGGSWRVWSPPLRARLVAFGPQGGVVAAGGGAVAVWWAGRWIRRSLTLTVADVARPTRHAIWVATNQGLWSLDAATLKTTTPRPWGPVWVRRLEPAPRGRLWAVGRRIWLVSSKGRLDAGLGLPAGAKLVCPGPTPLAADETGRLFRPRWVRLGRRRAEAPIACGPEPKPPRDPPPVGSVGLVPRLGLRADVTGAAGLRAWSLRVTLTWRPDRPLVRAEARTRRTAAARRSIWRARLAQWRACRSLAEVAARAQCDTSCHLALTLAAREAQAAARAP